MACVSLAKTGPGRDRETTDVKLRTFGLALIATAFTASTALAAMQPIANPPEKPKMMKHHKKMHHMAKKDPDAAQDKAEAKPAMPAKPAEAAKPAMPAKK